MKRLLSTFLLSILIFTYIFPVAAYGASGNSLDIISEAAVLMDAKTGQILFEKNMNKRMYPASITKIMTAVIGVERGNLEDIIIVSGTAPLSQYNVTKIDLVENEVVTFEQMLYACLLVSANDASNVIAEYIAGTQHSFVTLMNEKAQQIGALNTHFSNVHGLPDETHYSTAEDMALITKYAMGNLEFMRIFGSREYKMPSTNLTYQPRNLINTHDMLQKSSIVYYSDVVGGKLGWIQESQHTAVTVAQRGDRQLIAVVLKSPNRDDKYRDTKILLDYGFNEFNDVTISKNSIDQKVIDMVDGSTKIGTINCLVKDDFKFLLHNSVSKDLVEITYHIPSSVEADNIIEHYISFSLPSVVDVMYGELGYVPIIHVSNFYGEQVGAAMSPQNLSRIFKIVLNTLAATIIILAVIFVIRAVILFGIAEYKKYDYKKRQALLKQRIIDQENK